ncbi:MAG: hypothetical protein M1831_003584 [Alyxoria varia]|nr:MAG: hypothetical protein M1831_003584 [Alyxoria varia]
MPWHVKAKLQGRPGPEAGQIFHQWAQLPVPNDEYMAEVSELHKQYFPTARPLPGVPELLSTLSSTTKPHIESALATSSQRNNFELKTMHNRDMFSIFDEDKMVLGDDPRIPKGRGKPAPDIYLLALKTINDSRKVNGESDDIKPEECLVFEDSVPGVEAGRRAGMQVVWCPHPGLLQEFRGREKEVLAGLAGEYEGKIEPIVDASQGRAPGMPGQADDGWAILLESLVDFPFRKFGILN